VSKHWSERLVCSGCGMSFRSVGAEAQHRHCFPHLCRKPRQPRPPKPQFRPMKERVQA
jgi:hypothetical protein